MAVEDERQSNGDADASLPDSVGDDGRPPLPELPDGPDPSTRYRRSLNTRAALRSMWESRGITLSLAQRDLRASYSQEVLGFAWVLIGPIMLMVVLTFLKNVSNTKINTGGIEYPLFLYVGLLPWTFFSTSVSSSAGSLVNNPLLNKVYAPRETFVFAQIIEAVVNTVAAAVALIVLFVVFGRMPKPASVWAVPLLAILLVFTVGVSLFFASLTVFVRDVRHALPQALQLGFFVTPIFWGLADVSQGWRVLICAVNPVAAVIDGLRRSVFFGQSPDVTLTLVAAGMACLWLVVGYRVFKRLETGFADVS